MQDLSPDLARVARAIARRLGAAGARTWIVGGAPRDLALGLSPAEIDLCSAAVPETVQQLFERTIPLGRAFGTVIVHLDGGDVEHTTFRSESVYSDGRRPDAVEFGTSVEQDSERRDFTCNAIYLDPLNDEVADPRGGLDDLAARRLACVGDAHERFREDALRPLRMARFAGGLDLAPDAATLAAARAAAPTLAGVSRERVLREFEGVFRRSGAGRTLAILWETDLLEPALPGYAGLREPGADAAFWIARRCRALAALGPAPGTGSGLCVFLGPEPGQAPEPATARGLAILDGLRTSRALRVAVADAWDLMPALRSEREPARSVRVRWMRRPGFDTAIAALRAWARAHDEDAARWERLRAERAELGAEGLRVAALLGPDDLAERGIRPGPLYGEVLRDLETLQLDGALRTRAQALAWLVARIGGQDGGNTRRSP